MDITKCGKLKSVYITEKSERAHINTHNNWEGVLSFAYGICIGRGLSPKAKIIHDSETHPRIAFEDGSFLIIVKE